MHQNVSANIFVDQTTGGTAAAGPGATWCQPTRPSGAGPQIRDGVPGHARQEVPKPWWVEPLMAHRTRQFTPGAATSCRGTDRPWHTCPNL